MVYSLQLTQRRFSGVQRRTIFHEKSTTRSCSFSRDEAAGTRGSELVFRMHDGSWKARPNESSARGARGYPGQSGVAQNVLCIRKHERSREPRPLVVVAAAAAGCSSAVRLRQTRRRGPQGCEIMLYSRLRSDHTNAAGIYCATWYHIASRLDLATGSLYDFAGR